MKTLLLAMLTAAPALAADPAAAAINQLGLDLHRRLANTAAEANLCLSPYSIQCALAMTYAGADGATRAEMAKVLHYPEGDAIHQSLPALNQALAGITARTTKQVEEEKRYGGGGEPVAFNLANRLYGQEGYRFEAPFLAQLKNVYTAPLEPIDFAKSAQATKHINDWVEKETRDRIKKLIGDGILDGGTRLVLVNAVYLKAPWADKFNDSATKPKPFHVAGKEPTEVPTMMRQARFGYAKRDGYSAVTIPYYGHDLHFLVLVPDDVKGLAAVEKALTAGDLASCAKLPTKDLVILHLPKFKIEGGSVELGKELQALGMKTAFDHPAGSANFSKMAPRTPSEYLFISQVIHKTFIALDEKGTEAAAATAVVMRAGSAAPAEPPKPIEVKVDRPFLFAIQHRETGACLFLGRVTDPR
jgi:serpin B